MYLIGSIAPLVPNEMFLEHEERPAYGLFMAGLGSGGLRGSGSCSSSDI